MITRRTAVAHGASFASSLLLTSGARAGTRMSYEQIQKSMRTQCASALGLGGVPELIVRFGFGPELPFSLRRPVQDVIV